MSFINLLKNIEMQEFHNRNVTDVRRSPGRRSRRWLPMAALVYVGLTGCTSTAMRSVESLNHNSRVNIVVIHFTTADFAESLRILTQPSSNSVSSHYLIPELPDPSYDEREIRPYQLVSESRRAWHAGRSYWRGKTALNDQSIGIELVNRAYCDPGSSPPPEGAEQRRFCFFPDFSLRQFDVLVEVLTEIVSRHPDIHPTSFVGHSDIAPGRKIDPGPRFPWQRLAQLGFGAWYEDQTVIRYWDEFHLNPPSLLQLQAALGAYGYGIDQTGVCDQQTEDVVRSFQMHFRPHEVTGMMSIETSATLFALLDRYFPEQVAPLLEITADDELPTVAGDCGGASLTTADQIDEGDTASIED